MSHLLSIVLSTRPGAFQWDLHMVASADKIPLLIFLPERADGHETRLWALQAECSMLALCSAWATRAMGEREREESAGPLHCGEN